MGKVWIGESMGRSGGLERVTGAQRYTADLKLDRALQVKLVTVDCAHARILSIDTAAAARVKGVRCILTAADLPQPVPLFGPASEDRPVIAVGETRFHGEPVAAVAAETEDAAEEAAGLVRVQWEELPAVLTVEDALDPGMPLVQDPASRRGSPWSETNSDQEWDFGWGDPASARADLVLENDYTFPMVTHFAIEPQVFLAAPGEPGVTVWTPTQHPYVLQRVVASALGWPVSKVRIVAPDPGGAFGGKGWPKVEPLMAYLALKAEQPVRLVMSLEESFQASRRTSAKVHVRTGFMRDGAIAFQDIEANYLIGAYADIASRAVSKASYSACGPYRTPHARIHARALLSHTTPSTAFRGFGTPQVSWAVESQFSEAAARLGLDGYSIRARNVAEKGEAHLPGDTPADGHWKQALEAACKALDWERPLRPYHGRGVSLGMKSSSTVAASFAIVRLHHDGSVTVLTATSDMGQGARTVFTQMAAQELGVSPERVTIVMGDTTVVPFDSSTSASRSTVFMGNAIVNACVDIRKQLAEMASEELSIPLEQVGIESGSIISPARAMTYAEFLRGYFGSSRGEVIGVGKSRSKYVQGHPLSGRASFWEIMCVAVEVEVDPETGMVRIPKLVLASDVGKAINPQHVEMQDEGSANMGLGHTLMEHLILDDHGRIRNLGALDYRIPTVQDIPEELHSIMIENEDGPGPFGSKGVGEGGTLAIAAAVGAAVNEALGVTIRDLPLTPERVWRAIQEKDGH